MSESQASVLIAEDEDSFVDALVLGLRREGFLTTVAHDGVEALTLFDAVQPDLVLLDVMLPKLSGIDVCRDIRARSSVPYEQPAPQAGQVQGPARGDRGAGLVDGRPDRQDEEPAVPSP